MTKRLGNSPIIAVGIMLVKCRYWTYKNSRWYGGLTRDVANVENFPVLLCVNTRCYRKFHFFWAFNFIILGGKCTIIDYLMLWEVKFLFSCKIRPPNFFLVFIVGNHPILMEQNLRKFSPETKDVDFFLFSFSHTTPPYRLKTTRNPLRKPNTFIDKPPKTSDWEETE